MKKAVYILLSLALLNTFAGCGSKHKVSGGTASASAGSGKPDVNTMKYIARYKNIAKKEMKQYGVPASITLAQGILESKSGTSWLAREARNHFGIKCAGDWTGPHVLKTDDHKNECFRKYRKAEESFRDHSKFLAEKRRYAFLFRLPLTDYEAWAKGLKKAGYATDPSYPSKLIYIIKKYNLDQYDKEVLDEMNIKQQKNAVAEDEQDSDTGKKIIYEVKAGETLFTISKKFNIPVKDIKEMNNLVDFDIYEGQILVLKVNDDQSGQITDISEVNDTTESNQPEETTSQAEEENTQSPGKEPGEIKREVVESVNNVANAQETDKQPDTAGNDNANYIIHTVKPKETLFSIAKQYGVSMDAIKSANGMDSDVLHIGQQLKIPTQQTQVAAQTETETEAAEKPQYHIVQPGETLYRIHVNYKVSVEQLRQWNHLKDNTIHVGQKLRVK